MAQKEKVRETEEVVNVSGSPVKFKIARGHGEPCESYELAPGEGVVLDASYARPQVHAEGRDPRESTISLLTNKQVISIKDPKAAGVLSQRAHAAKMAAEAKAAGTAKAPRG